MSNLRRTVAAAIVLLIGLPCFSPASVRLEGPPRGLEIPFFPEVVEWEDVGGTGTIRPFPQEFRCPIVASPRPGPRDLRNAAFPLGSAGGSEPSRLAEIRTLRQGMTPMTRRLRR